MSVTETSHALPRTGGGTFPVTQVTPGARAPGLVVISSAYGVTDELRATMRRYSATAGYIVAAPDMFSRTVPGPLGQSEADRTAARGRLDGFDVALGLADMRAVMDDLRARPDCNGTIAVMGYCFGGEFAFLGTTELGAAGAISFHGVGIGKHLDEAGKVNVPMSLHFGEDDRFVPNTEVDAIEAAFRNKPDVEVYRYAGAKHGFVQSESAAYDAAAAQLSEERALAMLARLK